MGTFDHQIIYAAPKDGRGRLAFCWIQKVGCTSFKRLLSSQQVSVRDAYEGPPVGKTNIAAMQTAIMRNSSWHKAVFYREPLERFLSGYQDKCIKEPGRYYCKLVFGKRDATFDEAVRQLLTQDPNKLDGHFHAQLDFCGGLHSTLPYYDTAELLTPATSRESVGRMLERANVTSAYYDQLFPPAGRNATGHETGAYRKLAHMYRDGRHVGIVTDFFFGDYDLLNISLPDFAVRALLELNRTGDEHALPPERLERLLNITAEGRGIGTRELLGEFLAVDDSAAEDDPPVTEEGDAAFVTKKAQPPVALFLTMFVLAITLPFVLRWRRRKAAAKTV